MSTRHANQSTGDLTDFLTFLKGLWAALAGASVLFPGSNALLRIVPLASWTEGGFGYIAPAVVSAVSTLACAFVLLWTFGQRERLRASPLRSFGVGMASLLTYVTGHYAVSHDFYFRVLGWESADLRWLIGDTVLLVAYAAAFAFITRSFTVLGLREYVRRRAPEVKTRESARPSR